MPDLIEKANCMINKCMQNKKETTDKIISHMKKKSEEEKKENENKKQSEVRERIAKKEIKIEDEQE